MKADHIGIREASEVLAEYVNGSNHPCDWDDEERRSVTEAIVLAATGHRACTRCGGSGIDPKSTALQGKAAA